MSVVVVVVRVRVLGALVRDLDVLVLILDIDVHVGMIDAAVLFTIAQQYRVDVTFVSQSVADLFMRSKTSGYIPFRLRITERPCQRLSERICASLRAAEYFVMFSKPSQ